MVVLTFFLKLGDKVKGSAQYRIRTNMHQTLTKKFLDLMTEYQEVQTKYKNKYRERVERQYKIGMLGFLAGKQNL